MKLTPIPTRRHFLLGASALIPAALLVGCANSPLTPAQIITQAAAAAQGLDGMMVQVVKAYPSLIPPAIAAQISKYLALAESAAATLSPAIPAATGASTVKTVEGYINAVLTTLAAPPINGLIPAPFNMAVAAASFVVPQLEAFAGLYIKSMAASHSDVSARLLFLAHASAPITSASQAVQILQKFAAVKDMAPAEAMGALAGVK